MDPNANLEEQRELRKKIIDGLEKDRTVLPADIMRFAELVEALDEWLSKGWFLPKRWNRPWVPGPGEGVVF
jgi:hypothetical protein